MNSILLCPECNGRLDATGDETFCNDCGLVIAADRIDRGPEWRSFDDGPNRKRTGAPLTRSRHDRGLSTEIDRATRLTGRKRRLFARLRRQHNRARISSKAERNQVYAFTEIRRMVGALGLTDSIRDRACVLFESAQKADLLRGRSLEGFAAAVIYAVCRTDEISRTLAEICTVAKASRDELTAAYTALNRELGLPTGPINPTEYLARFASQLGLPCDIETRARELVGEGHSQGLTTGRNPGGVAAACLYTAATEAGHPLTQQAAADVAGVTPVTLRTTYYDLRE
ncbi:MAG TPA: transcription initiation factor IIB family protein [Halococcus sp.]|nr:transcription initiation factor IIB family protein [Halococcus sp.]